MNMYKWLEEIRNGRVKKPLPVLSYPAIQLMGINVKQLSFSAEAQAEGMRLVAGRTDSLASVSLMDLSVEAECFGSQVRMTEDEVPTVVGAIVTTPEKSCVKPSSRPSDRMPVSAMTRLTMSPVLCRSRYESGRT